MNERTNAPLQLDARMQEIGRFEKDRSLGDRMKEYENLTRFYLSKEHPLIIRLDGNAFHTFTRGFEKPFDKGLRNALELTAKYLVENIPGSQMAYHQSDEISILVTNYQLSNREPWFDNNVNKIVSLTASMATFAFNKFFSRTMDLSSPAVAEVKARAAIKGAFFDSRAFILPKEEVVNYFIWRQQDAIKNSVSMVAQALFSHKSLQNLNGPQMIEKMLTERGIVYEEKYTNTEKRGSVVHRLEPVEFEETILMKNGQTKAVKYTRSEWGIDSDIPVFKDNREYVERFL